MTRESRNLTIVCVLVLLVLTTPTALQFLSIRGTTSNPDPSDPLKATVGAIGQREIGYKIYDMFQEPWGPWWTYRYPAYAMDIILTDEPGNYSMLYNPDQLGYQGIIWAPYRMNITASNLTNVDVHHPEFMPVLDASHSFNGAAATIDVYFEYLSWDWWNNTWVPKWSNDPLWWGGSMSAETHDGWYLGVVYNVTMNREAAQEWLRLPVTELNVNQWWASNASSYKKAWKEWLVDQGNNVSDIYNAYEYPMAITGPYANLTELPNGDIQLAMAHVSWGYEILMNRWLTERQICSHQPYLEDCTLSAHLDNWKTNLTMDTVCQYGMHAVKANQSVGTDSAWVFEAVREDYIPSSLNHPRSVYDQFAPLTYMSWNAGDPSFGTEVPYGVTPGWFNLTANETLTFELPKDDRVIAYEGRGVGHDAINNITYNGYPTGGDFGEYTRLRRYGTMDLGYYVTNLGSGVPMDLRSLYDPVNKTLTIKGPHNFDNSGRGEGNPMYHGAPWIEFNVTYPRDGPYAVAGPDRIITSGQVVRFDGSESSGARTIANWTWTFEDAGVKNMYGVSPIYNFTTPGVYLVTLDVRDTGGNHDTDSLKVMVYAHPSASFVVSPASGDVSTSFVFNATGSSDLVDATGLLRVRWDWNGDSSWDTAWSTSKEVMHEFTSPGTYDVKCQVMNSAGLTNETVQSIVVTQVIPEFGNAVLTVMSIAGVIVATSSLRRTRRK